MHTEDTETDPAPETQLRNKATHTSTSDKESINASLDRYDIA